ncbi:MAG: SPOR domain-containing protein [Bacteroidetes bacterium]|nr:SPOR domain-containing protein [Bacteroidota bacterium]
MTSQEALKELTAIIRDRLVRYNHLTISGIGTLVVESIPSISDPIHDQAFVLHPPKKRIVLEENTSAVTDLSLISGLSSNLNLSHEEAASVIDLLIKEMMVQVPVEVPGLGTFTRSEEQLQFIPDPELILSVSGSYHGMDSIEVLQSPSSQVIEPRKKYVWSIIALPIAIALGIGAYLMIRAGKEPVQETSTNSVPPSTLSITPDSASTDSAKNFISFDSLAEEDSIDQTVENLSDIQSNSDLLTIDRETGGYTIILGSFETPERALTLVEQYRKIYPSLVVDTLVSTDNRYRAAIGQTPTIPEAVALKDSLTELPSSAWIKNILNDNL